MTHTPHPYYKEIYNSETDTYILYHGTSPEYPLTAIDIVEEGLIGGDNTTGGTHGVWDNYILFMAKEHHVAAKYGTVIIIEISSSEFEKFDMEKFNDGVGDRCYSLESKEEEVLIPSKYLSLCDCEEC